MASFPRLTCPQMLTVPSHDFFSLIQFITTAWASPAPLLPEPPQLSPDSWPFCVLKVCSQVPLHPLQEQGSSQAMEYSRAQPRVQVQTKAKAGPLGAPNLHSKLSKKCSGLGLAPSRQSVKCWLLSFHLHLNHLEDHHSWGAAFFLPSRRDQRG